MKPFKENVVRYQRDFKELRKAKQDQEMYEKEFYSNQISKQNRAAVFRDKM